MHKKLAIAAIATVILGAAAGAIFGEKSVADDEQQLVQRATRIVTTLLEWLPEEETPSDIVYDGIGGMLEVLDPHSNYLDPRTFQSMRSRQEGSFFGVGIIISRRNGKVTVIAPMAGTPAAQRGLRAGDVIAAVEGEATEEMNLNDVVDRVRGPEGSVVNLTIDRPGLKDDFDVAITRARIPTTSVRHALLVRPGVGYIRLSEFSNTSEREVKEAIETLTAAGMQSLIFDVRNNPGGALEAAVGVTDTFLRRDELIVTTRGRAEGNEATFSAPGRGNHFEGPLVILVNEGSASASEIVAGAVQDHDRGIVLGEVTWGKGLVQTVFTVRDTGLALTTARYYTPAGRCIQRDYASFIDYITHRNGHSQADAAGEAFQTVGGRTVLGSGGITPDVTVTTRELSENVVRLFGNSAFFLYAVELLKELPETEQAAVARAFTPTDEVVEAFLSWAEHQELATTELAAGVRGSTQDRVDIGRALHIEVYNAALGLDEGAKVAIEADDQFVAALADIEAATDLWQVYSARKK